MKLKFWLVGAILAAVVPAFAGTGSAEAATLVQTLADRPVAPAGTLEVEGKGVVTAVAGTCPTVVLTISGIPVTVNAATTLPAGQSCGQLAVNQRVEVRGQLTLTGSSLSVVATSIEVEDGEEGEGEGRVTAVTGTCPEITVTVDNLTVKVDTLTKFLPAGRGAGCELIKVGTKVKIKAVPAAGGGFRARFIEIKGQRHFGEGENRITTVTGSCPDATFYFGRTSVVVNAATTFQGGTCADLQPGVRVQARGFRDDDATQNVATFVKFKSRVVNGRSTVTAVSGACPVLALTVGGVKVVTTADTVFRGGACEALRAGVHAHVTGDMMSEDGSVIATIVTIESHPGGRPGGRLEGAITAVEGACPTLRLMVKGRAVSISAATRFDEGTCSTLKVGTKVEIEGDVQGAVLLASTVEVEH